SALIVGISFATSTAVPGSTDDGKPILGGQPAFDVFVTASLVRLGFSITTLVMFLVILTSPKQIQHFRLSLPLKLIFGLGSLFASIASEEADDGGEKSGDGRGIVIGGCGGKMSDVAEGEVEKCWMREEKIPRVRKK
ncbi:hypothetical protein V8G54_009134, partial [Vigna mungo]